MQNWSWRFFSNFITHSLIQQVMNLTFSAKTDASFMKKNSMHYEGLKNLKMATPITQVILARSEPAGSILFRHVPCNRIPVGFSPDEFRSVPVCSDRNRPKVVGISPVKNRPESGCKEHCGTEWNRSVPVVSGKDPAGSGGRNDRPGRGNANLGVPEFSAEMHLNKHQSMHL